jgi:hypothetical protein
VVLLDEQRRIVDVNDAALSLLGHDDQDLLDALLKIVGVPVLACAANGTLTHASRWACELVLVDCPLGRPPAAQSAAHLGWRFGSPTLRPAAVRR